MPDCPALDPAALYALEEADANFYVAKLKTDEGIVISTHDFTDAYDRIRKGGSAKAEWETRFLVSDIAKRQSQINRIRHQQQMTVAQRLQCAFFGPRGVFCAVDLLKSKGFIVHSLPLVYSAIDQCAYVEMPDSQEDVKGADFEAWIVAYMSPGNIESSEPLSPADMYSARCGMLHTFTSSTTKTRGKVMRGVRQAPTAREVFYSSHPEKPLLKSALQGTKMAAGVFVCMDCLIEETRNAIQKFIIHIETNPRPVYADRSKQRFLGTMPLD